MIRRSALRLSGAETLAAREHRPKPVSSRPFRLTAPTASESQTLRAVLHALSLHPKVARAWRANTGSGRLVRGDPAKADLAKSQFIEFGFKGQPDVLGFMRTGHFLAVETKRVGEKPTADQRAFLDAVADAGGVSFVAYSVEDVFAQLGSL